MVGMSAASQCKIFQKLSWNIFSFEIKTDLVSLQITGNQHDSSSLIHAVSPQYIHSHKNWNEQKYTHLFTSANVSLRYGRVWKPLSETRSVQIFSFKAEALFKPQWQHLVCSSFLDKNSESSTNCKGDLGANFSPRHQSKEKHQIKKHFQDYPAAPGGSTRHLVYTNISEIWGEIMLKVQGSSAGFVRVLEYKKRWTIMQRCIRPFQIPFLPMLLLFFFFFSTAKKMEKLFIFLQLPCWNEKFSSLALKMLHAF